MLYLSEIHALNTNCLLNTTGICTGEIDAFMKKEFMLKWINYREERSDVYDW